MTLSKIGGSPAGRKIAKQRGNVVFEPASRSRPLTRVERAAIAKRVEILREREDDEMGPLLYKTNNRLA